MKKQIPIAMLTVFGLCVSFILGVLVGRSAVGQHLFTDSFLNSTDIATMPTRSYIDINTASVSQLTLLPGVGAKTAQRVIDFREYHGAFTCVEDLLLIDGIGIDTLEAIRPYICAEG